MNEINYYKINEVLEHKYYQIPQELFYNPLYKHNLNSDSKILYGFLLDRLSLSMKHRWYDENGNIYLIFTRKDVGDKLCLSEKTVTKAFKQLSEVNLINEKRQGLSKPNLIYVGKIIHYEIPDVLEQENLQLLNGKFYGSGAVENTVQDEENFPTINTNNINTNISNLILSNQGNEKAKDIDEIDEVQSYEDIFKENIEYEILISDSDNAELIKNITATAIETLNSKKNEVYINSEAKSTNIVRSQLLKITPRSYCICYKLLKK